ncbi:MAG: alanine racemase [Myxococcales bacterium]|nr:alanine racemase [Myxococcales bacterium]
MVGNARLLSEKAGCELFAVVKADAYGHGAQAVAAALEREAVKTPGFLRGLAVSLVEEGVELREAGIELPILVMGPSLMDAHALLVEQRLTPMVSDSRHLTPLANAARALGKQLGIHLKVDTGMGRLGIQPAELEATIGAVQSQSALRLEGVASHLACADVDEPSDLESLSAKQLARFDRLVRDCRANVPTAVQYHVANSAAILRFPKARYDLARPGLALYGNGASAAEGLSQAMRLVSEVSQTRHVAAGQSVSYGARWTAERDSTVAIVPLGYADGLPRNLNAAGQGSALVGGARCPIIGTVSMDMIVVDITDRPELTIGHEVVAIGGQGDTTIRIAEVAALCGISEYEVSCGISKRVPRRYVNDDG